MSMKYQIRELLEAEYSLFNDFLYEAIFIPAGMEAPLKTIINLPELQVYVKDFGQSKDDYCLVAEVQGTVVGAVWTRIMDDYGHIDNQTPSLAISLYKEYRNQGIGTTLMEGMLSLLTEHGYRSVSLSVQKENYAVKLYRKLGFETVTEHAGELIMRCRL